MMIQNMLRQVASGSTHIWYRYRSKVCLWALELSWTSSWIAISDSVSERWHQLRTLCHEFHNIAKFTRLVPFSYMTYHPKRELQIDSSLNQFLFIKERNKNISWSYGGWLRNPAPVDERFVPFFVGFQPSFCWCRISQPQCHTCHTVPKISARSFRTKTQFYSVFRRSFHEINQPQGGFLKWGIPIAGWFISDNSSKMDDSGGTPISGNSHIILWLSTVPIRSPRNLHQSVLNVHVLHPLQRPGRQWWLIVPLNNV